MREEYPNLMKATESIKKIIKEKNIQDYDDIPPQVFINISKYNKVKIEEIRKQFKNK